MSWITEVHESAAEGRLKACYERVRKAIEVFGASGLRRERPVERYLRWATVTAFIDGTPQVQQLVIARDLLRAR